MTVLYALSLHLCDAVTLAEIDLLAKGDQINSVRAYLSLVRYLDFTIHQSTSSFLENQLVDARKQDKDLDPSTMHTWLTVSHFTEPELIKALSSLKPHSSEK